MVVKMNMNGKILSAVLLLFIGLTALGAGGLWAKAGRHVSGREVVYPPANSTLVFSHKKHLKTDCLVCHSRISQSVKSSDRNLPDEQVCAACHAEGIRSQVNEPGSEKRCGSCHADYDPTNKNRPARAFRPMAALQFSHKSHLDRMMACSACHAVKDKRAPGFSEERWLPSESLCLTCHDAWKQGGMCIKCHPQNPAGEMKTDFKGIKLVPSRGKLNHQENWTKRHVQQAQFAPATCKTCHQQRFCDRCHDGVMKPLAIHPEDYATMHPIDARKDQNHCRSCHRYQSFCLDCHQKMGMAPDSQKKYDRVRIHPEGFGSCVRTPTHHSDQAKRSLDACVSCHQEDDCLRCHRSGSECGGSVNIHGHMSPQQLSRMQKKNPRACEKCH